MMKIAFVSGLAFLATSRSAFKQSSKYDQRSFILDPAPSREAAQSWLQMQTRRSARPEPIIGLNETFSLHSKRSATKVIYLDFTGRNVSGTVWNEVKRLQTIHAPSFDMDGDPSTYSTSERKVISKVWQAVSEDFAPFEIDVTTEYAGDENFLIRSSNLDDSFGIRVLISPICDVVCEENNPACAGVAFPDHFSDVGKLR